MAAAMAAAMAAERGLAMATCTAPVNIAVIKYCECHGTRAGAGWAPARGGTDCGLCRDR